MKIIGFGLKAEAFILETCTGVDLIRNLVFQIRIPDVIVAVKTVVDLIAIAFRNGRGTMTVAPSDRKIKLFNIQGITGI